MSYEMRKYLEGYDGVEDIEFSPCCITQALGDSLFAYVTELEDGVFLLQRPARVINNLGRDIMELVEFCEFSDDTYFILKESSIESICYLSSRYLGMYNDFLKGTTQQEDDIMEDIQVPEGSTIQ